MISTSSLLTIARGIALVGVLALVLAGGWASPATAKPAAQASPTAALAGTPVAAEGVEFSGLVETPGIVTVDELRQLPTETVEVSYESGGEPETHTFTGVRLIDVLGLVGLDVDPEARNPMLAMYLIVTAKDGYQVVLSGGELDPNFGNAPMLLAWEQDGAPLSAEDGPVRLVVPGDLRGGRYVWGVIGIEVRTVDEAVA